MCYGGRKMRVLDKIRRWIIRLLGGIIFTPIADFPSPDIKKDDIIHVSKISNKNK